MLCLYIYKMSRIHVTCVKKDKQPVSIDSLQRCSRMPDLQGYNALSEINSAFNIQTFILFVNNPF